MRRFHALSAHFRASFGRPVRKAPLDAGFSCPNRDGAVALGGCAFCNAAGSGTGLHARGVSLAEQWRSWIARSRQPESTAWIAYLQSYSNTYGKLARIREALAEIAALPGAAGLAIGTRPDCLDEDRADLLAALPFSRESRTWVDLGLQSANDETLARVRRGHGLADFERAAALCAERGLLVCAHMIFGLPGETPRDWLHTARVVSALPVAGVKFHNLYICEGSRLAEDWREGLIAPLERREYVDAVVSALEILPPRVVVHRLASDPAPGELLAPGWAARKSPLLADIEAALSQRGTWQGRLAGAPDTAPDYAALHPLAPGSR